MTSDSISTDRKGFDAKRIANQLSCALVDEIAGLPGGYTGKLTGCSRVRKLGRTSLGLVLQTLGVKLLMVDDPEALAKVRGRYHARDENRRRVGLARKAVAPEMREEIVRDGLREYASRGGLARRQRMTADQRRASSSHAAQERWRRVRAVI